MKPTCRSIAILASTYVTCTEGFALISSQRHVSASGHQHRRLNHVSSPSPSRLFTITNPSTLTLSMSSNDQENGQEPEIPEALKQRLQSSASGTPITSNTSSYTSNNNTQEGPGIIPSLFISGVLLFFAVSAIGPLLDSISVSSQPPAKTDLSLGDSVITRQDGDNKLKNYESKFDALSMEKIQEKLENLPVFYVGDGRGIMGNENVYFSYSEAESAAKGIGGSSVVKVTTLDQIMYPLILKRGNVKVSSVTPVEIRSAQQQQSADKTYKLVPSAAALNDAKDTSTTLKEGDIPLFIVERLAFAGPDGKPQVPLFLEKFDAITSYSRLRESGGNKLPEEPTLRTTSLLDVLDSMERGTRPGVGRLQFYGEVEDVLKADEMMASSR
eukprot:scaffold1230_cov201-Alexandrium_tamarense.AAC.33